jgi:hypothetical protein
MTMKIKLLIAFSLLIAANGCDQITTENLPPAGSNLLHNPTFDSNGTPSLQDWTVPDTGYVHFSSDAPFGGSGHTIAVTAHWFAVFPAGMVYQSVLPSLEGTHQYRLSVYGKRWGIPGSLWLTINRPSDINSVLRMSIPISDTVWTFYVRTDTITTHSNDSLFVVIDGGNTEIAAGITYFNTCKLEKLD